MGQTHRIRRAGDADRNTVARLWLDLIEYHRSLEADYPPEARLRDLVRAEVGRGLRDDACRLLVAERETDIDGFLFAEVETSRRPERIAEPRSWVHELWVRPERRRRGLGSALLREAAAFFRERGGQRISVRVDAANEAGLRFWRRHRFTERAHVLERVDP